MSHLFEKPDHKLLDALNAVEVLLIDALSRLDACERPTTVAAEIDLALYHLRIERDALNRAASAS